MFVISDTLENCNLRVNTDDVISILNTHRIPNNSSVVFVLGDYRPTVDYLRYVEEALRGADVFIMAPYEDSAVSREHKFNIKNHQIFQTFEAKGVQCSAFSSVGFEKLKQIIRQNPVHDTEDLNIAISRELMTNNKFVGLVPSPRIFQKHTYEEIYNSECTSSEIKVQNNNMANIFMFICIVVLIIVTIILGIYVFGKNGDFFSMKMNGSKNDQNR